MYDISLHLLDIVENSIAASASRVDVRIVEDRRKDRLVIDIRDNGRGMDNELREKALDPFFTTKPGGKTGLGLPLFAQASEESGGSLKIESRINRGTRIIAIFQLSHIDRKPLGNMDETMRVLRATHPEIIFDYRYQVRD